MCGQESPAARWSQHGRPHGAQVPFGEALDTTRHLGHYDALHLLRLRSLQLGPIRAGMQTRLSQPLCESAQVTQLCNRVPQRARVLSHFSPGRRFVTPWAVAHQAPLSILQARILEWVAMPSAPGHVPDSGIELTSLTSLYWQAGYLPLMPPGKPPKYFRLGLKQ